MTRINTNVSSLVARNTLGRSNAALEQSLTRLSTGLRINTGKDDPAGLIASENLRSDITSIRKAISNTDRANQVIATADSALGQVSSLLNDIRGLVTESANSGGLSQAQLDANQLQIDQSLKALNRIAQTTTFQGRKLLDGSLDFITASGTNFAQLADLQIDQANLGASGSVSVNINVATAATQAQVDITGFAAATAAANASANVSLSHAITQATNGVLTYGTGTLTLNADAGGAADGAEGNALATIALTYGNGVASSSYTAATNTLTVNVTTADGATDVTDIVTAINAGTAFTAATGANALVDQAAATGATVSTALTGGRDAGATTIKVQADSSGTTANGVTVTLVESGSIASGTAEAAIVSGNIQVSVNGTVSYANIISAINGLTGYSAVALSGSGDQNYVTTLDAPPAASTLTGGAAAAGGLTQDAVFRLSGLEGAEVFTFGAGTSIADVAAGINAQSDSTGITATVNATTLELKSADYGSTAFVEAQVVTEASGGTISTGLGGDGYGRDEGTDVVASVNGILANGKGNQLSINTATLDLSTTVAAAFTGTASFSITGGGALFQLGPDVVSSQQARIGINGVNTSLLGGVSGKLFQLGTGGSADLNTSPNIAASIVEEAVDQITTLRGRLGAFQRTLLETNKNALNDTLVNLSDAESSIRDADFAVESAALTRAQILVQSGTTVLQIANQNPQNVLALLR